MPTYEYKVVPAPTKGLKAKGVKGPEARFSHAIEDLMNTFATEGWEYQRAETLPSTERAGLTGSTTEWRNLLVFRRLRPVAAELPAPQLLPSPEAIADPVPEASKSPAAVRPIAVNKATDDQRPESRVTAALHDETPDAGKENPVPDTSDTGGMSSIIKKFAADRKSAKSDN